MPKKTTILIVILLLFTVGLIYIALQTEQQSPPEIAEETVSEEEAQRLIPTISPQTDIAFAPQTINIAESPQSTYSANILVNTNNQSISGVQLELSYDPEILNNVTVTPAADNLFGENPAVLINSVDPELGRISLAIALGGIDDEEVSGTGNIATINFGVNFTAAETTEISILPKTTVRSLRSTNSLLQDIQPLTIIISSPTIQPDVTLPPAVPEIQPL